MPTPTETDTQGTTEDGSRATTETDVNRQSREPLERRVAELEAELAAVRGLLGGVEAADEAVAQNAAVALSKVESLERRLGPSGDGLVTERLPKATESQEGQEAQERSAEAQRTTSNTDREPEMRAAAGARTRPQSSDPGDSSESLATRLRDALQ